VTIEVIYDVALNSIGGKLSPRKNPGELLRTTQLEDNCGTASLMAVLDKNYVSASMAERMRALTLFRNTKAYSQAILSDNEVNTAASETRHRLLYIGAQATLTAVQRAVEVGGFIGDEATELLVEAVKIRDHIDEVIRKNFGAAQITVTFDAPKLWTDPKTSVDTSKLFRIVSKSGTPSQKGTKGKNKTTKTARDAVNTSKTQIKDRALNSLVHHSENLQTHPHIYNLASIITPLDLEAVTTIGLEDARAISTDRATNLQVTDTSFFIKDEKTNFLDQDRLNLLHRLVENPEVMKANLDVNPGLINIIRDLCSHAQRLAELIYSPETHGFFAFLPRILRKTVEKLKDENGQPYNLDNLPDTSATFKQLIADTDHINEKDKLKVLHLYRIKSFEKDLTLTLEEAGDLLASLNYLKTFGNPTNLPINPDEVLKDAKTLVDVAYSHFNTPESTNALLNAVATGVDPDHTPGNWKWDDSDHVYAHEDKKMFFNLDTGRLDRYILGKTLAQEKITKDPLYKSLVGNTTPMLEIISDTEFQYKHPSGTNYRFIIGRENVFVQRQFNDHWYQAIDPSEGPTLPIFTLPSRYKQQDIILWASVEPKSSSTIFYCTEKNEKTILAINSFTPKDSSTLANLIGINTQLRAELLTYRFKRHRI